MRKLFLATLGISTSLLAITQEQQTKIDELFNQKEQNISQSSEFGAGEKQSLIQALKEEKAKVEKMSDEEIEEYLDEEANASKDKKEILVLRKGEEWLGGLFGASGLRVSTFFGGNNEGAYMGYATIGPTYNFSGMGWTMGTQEGFSLSLPIGLGFINTSGVKNEANFALPIALEAKYLLKSGVYRFGFSTGLRYTYSPQEIGDLHFIDFYIGMDLIAGAYLEVGYVFYSSQDIKIVNKTISTDPLSGAITFNIGLRF